MARDDATYTTESAARGRLGQDIAFTIDELEGARLRRLRAVYLRPSGALLLLYLEADRPGVHRLFLDAGIAFWEDWGEVLDDDDDLDWRDLGAAWGLVDATIDPAEFDGPDQVRLVRP